MLAYLGEMGRESHARWVDIRYRKSPKNKPASDFLATVGAHFKQGQNGDLLYRFPATYAAEVVYEPRSFEAPTAAPDSASASKPGSDLPRIRRGFPRCRSIALELAAVADIHKRVTGGQKTRSPGHASYTPPGTEMERRLCSLWQDLLNLDRVGISDSFFELGGHSLLAVRLFAEIERMTGRKLPLVTLFQAPTIQSLAASLAQGTADSRSLLVPIQPKGNRPPLFLVHGAGGDVLWGYANLAAHLGEDQPVYGIKSRGQLGLQEFSTLEEMANCYVRELRAFQPSGPYYVGGYCFGGNVAYEMARQLTAAGEAVALVALLDSAPSNAGYETVRWWQPAFGVRFIRNLMYWLGDFRRLEPVARRRFISRKAGALFRRIRTRFGLGNSRPEEVDLHDVIDTSHFPEHELKLWQAHLQALTTHVEKRYDGKVALLRTRGQPLFCSLEPDFCWGRLAARLEVRLVPGSHEEVFMEPHVGTLADQLRRCLAESAKSNPAVGSRL